MIKNTLRTIANDFDESVISYLQQAFNLEEMLGITVTEITTFQVTVYNWLAMVLFKTFQEFSSLRLKIRSS